MTNVLPVMMTKTKKKTVNSSCWGPLLPEYKSYANQGTGRQLTIPSSKDKTKQITRACTFETQISILKPTMNDSYLQAFCSSRTMSFKKTVPERDKERHSPPPPPPLEVSARFYEHLKQLLLLSEGSSNRYQIHRESTWLDQCDRQIFVTPIFSTNECLSLI